MSCFEILRAKGYRLTPQRLMVLEALHAAEGHISAPEIFARIQAKYPYLNKSTVYRTIELLKDLELVTEARLGEDTVYYHHAEKGHHHHLVCERCGKVVEIREDTFASLEAALRTDYAFNADLRHLAVRGRCLKCRC